MPFQHTGVLSEPKITWLNAGSEFTFGKIYKDPSSGHKLIRRYTINFCFFGFKKVKKKKKKTRIRIRFERGIRIWTVSEENILDPEP